MSTLVFLAIVFIIIGIIVERKKIGGNEKTSSWMPYRKKDYLLTVAERNFYEVLKKVADEHDCIVFVKVRLEDLLWLPRDTPNQLKWRGYVRSRHIDFVLCNKNEIKPICAIELDDASHSTYPAQNIDNLKEKIFASAKLPLLRIKTQSFYNPISLAQTIMEKIDIEK